MHQPKYRGVSLKARGGKKPWYARITIGKHTEYLGSFETAEEAAMRYNMECKLRKLKYRLNKVIDREMEILAAEVLLELRDQLKSFSSSSLDGKDKKIE